MEYLPNADDTLTYGKTQNNLSKTSLLESDDNIQNNIMIHTMNELLTTMQKIQQMFIEQLSQKKNVDKIPSDKQNDKNVNIEKPSPSQTEILLQQIQTAMQSTIAQLSNRRDTNLPTIVTNTDIPLVDEKQLTISEKWRLYTEMYQSKDECCKEYCLNKMKLGQELGLSFKETKREMLIGLWSNRLSVVLYLKQHETEDDLLKDIDEWEKIESARSDVFKKYRHKFYRNN